MYEGQFCSFILDKLHLTHMYDYSHHASDDYKLCMHALTLHAAIKLSQYKSARDWLHTYYSCVAQQIDNENAYKATIY